MPDTAQPFSRDDRTEGRPGPYRVTAYMHDLTGSRVEGIIQIHDTEEPEEAVQKLCSHLEDGPAPPVSEYIDELVIESVNVFSCQGQDCSMTKAVERDRDAIGVLTRCGWLVGTRSWDGSLYCPQCRP